MSQRFSRRALLTSFAVLPVISTLGRSAFAGQASASQPAQRIISVGAPVTEILYALGAQDDLIAIDSTSHYPADTAQLASVGYMRALSAEGLLSLSPTLVLAQDGSGPQAVLDQVREAGVTTEMIPDVPTRTGLHDKIVQIAKAVGKAHAGTVLADQVLARLDEASQAAKGHHGLHGLRTLCLIHAGQGNPMVAGSGTVADALIHFAGGVNAMADIPSYRPLSVEAAIAAAPDVVIVPSYSVDQAGGLKAILADPLLAQTPAAAKGQVAVIDSSLLLGMGPRTPDAIGQISAALKG